MIYNPLNQLDFGGDLFEDDLIYLPKVQNKDITCPNCSQRLSDLNETLFVGCPECYKVFAPYITELALRIHGKSEHIGKIVDPNRTKAKLNKEIEELTKLEKQAVLERDYLRAEEIKRKIKALRGQWYGCCWH